MKEIEMLLNELNGVNQQIVDKRLNVYEDYDNILVKRYYELKLEINKYYGK
jgi:hypothetical protein